MTSTRTRQICLFAALLLFVSACDWSGFGFDVAHTRSTPDPAPAVGAVRELAHVWSGPTTGPITSNPVLVGDTAVVTTTAGKLVAFGPVDAPDTPRCQWQTVCSPRWTAALAGASTSTPALSGGVVYAASNAGTLETFDLAGQARCSGDPVVCTHRWSTVPVGTITSSPLVNGTTVYVGSADGNLYAYDARGITNCTNTVCSPLWRGPTGGAVSSSPAGSGSTIYVGSADGNLVAFDAAGSTNCTGGVCSPLWTAPTGDAVRSSPAIAGGNVYIGSDSGTLSAFDAAGSTGCSGTPRICSPRWTASTAGSSGCGGVPKQCQPLWSASLGGAVRGSPALANRVVYAGTSTGTLAAFDSTGVQGCSGSPVVCTPMWSGTVPGATSPPATSNGRVLVGSATGLEVYRLVVPESPPELTTQALTSDHSDVFKFTADAPDHATARAGTDNVSGNTRVVFTHPADPATTDSQTCGTWSSDAGSFDQEGAALRVHTVDGGVKAITVTKNVVFGAKWIFNLHVWDTSRLPVAIQIGAFDLSPVFYPNQTLRPLPWSMCARTEGSTVSFVVWPSSQARPAWNDAASGGSVTLPSGYGDRGAFGWYVGHLRASDEASFRDLDVGSIPGAAGAPSQTLAPRAPTAIPGLP